MCFFACGSDLFLGSSFESWQVQVRWTFCASSAIHPRFLGFRRKQQRRCKQWMDQASCSGLPWFEPMHFGEHAFLDCGKGHYCHGGRLCPLGLCGVCLRPWKPFQSFASQELRWCWAGHFVECLPRLLTTGRFAVVAGMPPGFTAEFFGVVWHQVQFLGEPLCQLFPPIGREHVSWRLWSALCRWRQPTDDGHKPTLLPGVMFGPLHNTGATSVQHDGQKPMAPECVGVGTSPKIHHVHGSFWSKYLQTGSVVEHQELGCPTKGQTFQLRWVPCIQGWEWRL